MLLQNVARILLPVVALAACQTGAAGSITLDQEVLLKNRAGTPNAIVQMPDGGFVIAGNMGAAWAARTDPEGRVHWQLEDSEEDLPSNTSQSEFKGAVPLANGRVLLCGTKNTAAGMFGLIVIVDPDGKVVDRRKVLPSHLDHGAGEFRRCRPWDDGVALLGTGGSRQGPFGGWLMKLDKNARPLWEKLEPALPANDMLEVAGHDLVVADQTGLVRVDISGKEVGQRALASWGIDLLHTLKPARGVSILRYGEGKERGKVFLCRLDEQLRSIGPEQPIGPYRVNFGRGYVLEDGSVVLFGQVELQPAMIELSGSGAVAAVKTYPSDMGSFAVRDAAPLAAARFVAVRTQNVLRGVTAQGIAVPDDSKSGIVMTWVSFK